MGSPDIGDGSAYDPIPGRRRTHTTPTPPAPADDAPCPHGEACPDARRHGKTRFVPAAVPGGPRMYDFETMRSIAVGAAQRARDLPGSPPNVCADLVLADLGIERNPGPAVRMEFESQIVFCRVCGRPPQQHPFGKCADLRIGGEPR